MSPWTFALLCYCSLTVLAFLYFVGIWADQRRMRSIGERMSYSEATEYEPEVLHRYARLALAAPLWPLMLLGVVGKTFGTMLGRLMVDARGGRDE